MIGSVTIFAVGDDLVDWRTDGQALPAGSRVLALLGPHGVALARDDLDVTLVALARAVARDALCSIDYGRSLAAWWPSAACWADPAERKEVR